MAPAPGDERPHGQHCDKHAGGKHDTEAVIGDPHRWLVRAREVAQPSDLAGHGMRHDQAESVGDLHCPAILLRRGIGPGDHRPGRAFTGRVCVPVCLDGSQLGRLVLGQGSARQVANQDLHRGDNCGCQHRESEHRQEEIDMTPFEQVPGTEAGHDHRAQFDAGEEHVSK